jgi:8-oxo-dGTP pyrophosphatase MutT (NUDIX family)
MNLTFVALTVRFALVAKLYAQAAALPLRLSNAFKVEVLIVTSRDTGRWVPPKGWTNKRKSPWSSAKIEAWEEAGAIGAISKTPLGTYDYNKILNDGTAITCRVTLYPMIVQKLSKKWKEKHERTRCWFSPEQAARRVCEPELGAMISSIEARPDWLRKMLKKYASV